MSELLPDPARRHLGVRDIPLVALAPRRLFSRAEDVPAWGWPLLLQLVIVTLVGCAIVQTGLIDREVDLRVRDRIADVDRMQGASDAVERSVLRERYEREIKAGQFELLLTRMRVIAAAPLQTLASALLIAAVLYGAVALTGRKPEWHTLLSICVFAGFLEVLRQLVLVGFMLGCRTLEVDTSAAALLRLLPPVTPDKTAGMAALAGALSAVDPFRIWFWLVVIAGLSVTMQLPGWRAWLVCGLGWLTGAGARAAMAFMEARASLGAAGPEM